MRSLYDPEIDRLRNRSALVVRMYGSIGDDRAGAFQVPSPIDRKIMVVIAASDLGWDHISVSRATRIPNWTEMEFVKRLFFKETETAMQLHVPSAEHINCHPFCLHIWRPHAQEIPCPPPAMVGFTRGERSNVEISDGDAVGE